MAIANHPNPYLKTQVETASKEQLVVMLFDGIIRFSEQARKAIEKKEVEEGHHNLMRAQAIIMELIYTIDREKGGEIAKSLMSLHAYSFNCLIAANMKKDVSKIDEVQKIYRELREGWVVAMQSIGISATTSAAPASATPDAAQPVRHSTSIAGSKSGAYGIGKAAVTPIAPVQPAAPAPTAKSQVYAPGKTMAAQSIAQPKTNAQGVIIPAQQQRSSQMLSAYNNGRNIA